MELGEKESIFPSSYFLQTSIRVENISDKSRLIFSGMMKRREELDRYINRMSRRGVRVRGDDRVVESLRRKYGNHVDFLAAAEAISQGSEVEWLVDQKDRVFFGLYIFCYIIGKPPSVRKRLLQFRQRSRGFASKPEIRDRVLFLIERDSFVRDLLGAIIENRGVRGLPFAGNVNLHNRGLY